MTNPTSARAFTSRDLLAVYLDLKGLNQICARGRRRDWQAIRPVSSGSVDSVPYSRRLACRRTLRCFRRLILSMRPTHCTLP